MGAGGSCCRGTGEDERMVAKMDLSHCGCTEVPPIVFQAERYVETLNLSHNRILSLAPQLFHCQELKHLNLVDNGLDSLPPAIGSLPHLVSLKLDKNCIKDLPENLKNCRKLKRLSLCNNQLQQLPGIVTQLISLEELYLNDCDFSFLPASVGRLTKLRILELRNNRLCKLPLSMSRLTALTRLDLGDNSFETQPDCASSFSSLQELLMDNNDLEIFSGAGLKKLEHLDLSYNNLKSIAKDIGQCSALTLLNLGWNYLEVLPESIGNFTQLEGLIIEMNELAALPKSIGSVTKLEELNLSNNRLGDLPSTLGLLRSLKVLNFSKNYVQELPCEIGSCQRLSIVNASYNRLQNLPAEIGYLSNLKVLDLVGNFLMYLPISMSNLNGIRAIWLSANQNVPLIPFTEDVSVASGERFLTNIALPQLGETALPPVDSSEPVEKTSWRRKIRFEEDEDVLPGRLDRTPTPFPKELRCPARKAPRADDNYVNVVDGRVAVFQQAQQPPSNHSISDGNVAVIREANIRRNKDSKSEEDNYKADEHEQQTESTQMGENGRAASGYYDSQESQKIDANGDAEPTYGHRGTRHKADTEPVYGNGRMSPITEEIAQKTEEIVPIRLNGNSSFDRSWKPDAGRAGGQMVPEAPYTADHVDAVSVDSFESERRQSLAESMDNRSLEINRNQVIYSNVRNGNPCQPNYLQTGYSTPPQPVYHNGVDNYVPYRNIENEGQRRQMTQQNGPRPVPPRKPQFVPGHQSPYGYIQQPPYGNIQQSPYGSIRSSPRPPENGNSPSDMERPPSKQEMLSIAERNLSQNIAPPCYEIAKMYSTKAALFEHCHRQNST